MCTSGIPGGLGKSTSLQQLDETNTAVCKRNVLLSRTAVTSALTSAQAFFHHGDKTRNYLLLPTHSPQPPTANTLWGSTLPKLKARNLWKYRSETVLKPSANRVKESLEGIPM